VIAHTFRVELSEADFHALLKAAPKGKRLTARLAAAEETQAGGVVSTCSKARARML
jgi:hypothetical protein